MQQNQRNPYETDPLVNMYMTFDYGSRVKCLGTLFPQFPVVQALICEQILKKFKYENQTVRALDIGCAVGRTSFELTRHFDEVVGFDYSQRFVDAAQNIQNNDEMQYQFTLEGEIQETQIASLSSDNQEIEYQFLAQIFNCEKSSQSLKPIKKNSLKFLQSDACNMSQNLGKFHCAIAANLLCRLPDPEKFLKDVGNFIVPGGFLVLLSPYTWLAEYTPKEKWLGGKYVNGEKVETKNTIEELLSEQFEPFEIQIEGSGYDDPLYGLLQNGESRKNITIPFCLRETKRRFQLTFSEMSVFKKK